MSSLLSAAPCGQDAPRPFPLRIRRAPDGPRPLDLELAERIEARDQAAIHELAQTGRGLIATWVEFYRPKAGSLTDDDLWQEGYVALAEAATNYRVSRGVRFSTYAHQCIGWHLGKVIRRVNRPYRYGPKGARPKRVLFDFDSLGKEQPAGEDPWEESRAELYRLITRLTERQQQALTLRAEGLTQEEIGRALGITKEGARLLLARAIRGIQERTKNGVNYAE